MRHIQGREKARPRVGFLSRASIACSLAVGVFLTVFTGFGVFAASPAQAWCNIGVNRWQYNGYTLHVQTSIPAAWNTAISNSRAGWNNVSGSALVYYSPQFNDNNPNVSFLMYQINFSSIGLQDIPGNTYNNSAPPSATHSYSAVRLNSTWTWNTSGTMNQSQKKADVQTVT